MNKENKKESKRCNLHYVVGSAFKPKYVNNGNVFGTGDWYTFYCGNCGSQIVARSSTCDGSGFAKGCGANVDWD